MSKQTEAKIEAKGYEIRVRTTVDYTDYISITDIAKYKSDAPDDVVKTGYVIVRPLNFWDYGKR
jgi:hypothetical protein